MYKIILSKTAIKHISELERSGSPAYKKLGVIIEELKEHPRTGVGKPEQLKYQEAETWSRKIDKKNRITYSIQEEIVTVEVLSALGHYDDK